VEPYFLIVNGERLAPAKIFSQLCIPQIFPRHQIICSAAKPPSKIYTYHREDDHELNLQYLLG
jgi:hypothetical protein